MDALSGYFEIFPPGEENHPGECHVESLRDLYIKLNSLRNSFFNGLLF